MFKVKKSLRKEYEEIQHRIKSKGKGEAYRKDRNCLDGLSKGE